MADLIDYLTAPTSNTWGAKRAADGHPNPYQVAQIELGNEERVDEGYATKFVALAQAIWSKAPNMILTVGDMTYRDMIANPDHITGADSGLDHLGAYKTILDLAASMNGPLAIDLHFFTDTPEFVAHCVDVVANFDAWIQRYNPSVNYHIGIFELNANEHDVGRALGNAVAIGKLKSMGNRISVVTSANALEPDHQNDDGWSQGLIFFNTSRAWIQPPGYVMQMISEDYLPTAVEATTSNPALQVAAFTDGSSLSLHVVNMFDAAQTTPVSLMGYSPSSGTMTVTMIRGSRGDVNDASNPTRITPSSTTSNVGFSGGSFTYTFPGNSFTILRLK
ncbi:glycoside hydrolase [Thozetella sp. PMI_491]|nr:glycoside hydrolase [Thozetella sp. PMI_491]